MLNNKKTLAFMLHFPPGLVEKLEDIRKELGLRDVSDVVIQLVDNYFTAAEDTPDL